MKSRYGIVILTKMIYGGAEKRITELFRYLYNNYSDNVYFFVSHDLREKILHYFPGYPLNNVIAVGLPYSRRKIKNSFLTEASFSAGEEIKKLREITLLRKVYRYLKNLKIQYLIYKEIDNYRRKYNIDVFMGIASGIIPLYFYLGKRKRKVGVICCNMDSWFSDVYPNERKYWYKKYSSYNYGLENSDYVDFLSPFILDGVRQRGVKIKDETISITPASFTDYSKCHIGEKVKFEVAFAARLEKDKNPLLFLDAAILVSGKYPEIVFHIMGEGRLSGVVKDGIAASGCENIIYHGFHSNPPEVFASTSVFVSIQTTNNYPSQSVLEAMACGNAIIATDVGDTRMFINNENGLLIDLDVRELCGSIEKLYKEREVTKKMGKFAARYVKANHSIGKSAEYYLTLFEKAHEKVSNKFSGQIK